MKYKGKIEGLRKLDGEAKRLGEWGISRSIQYQIKCYEKELQKEKVRNEKSKTLL